MKAATIDGRRRLVMPDNCPAGTLVTVETLDNGVWLVKSAKPEKNVKLVLIPAIERLPDDAVWEKFEKAAASNIAGRLPAFEE